MKNLFLIAFAMLIIPCISEAQSTYKKAKSEVKKTASTTQFGIKGGLNFYNLHNSNDAKYDTRTGYHLGLLAHMHINNQWAIQPELVYSSQGAKFKNSGVETKLRLGYINLPIMVQYMFDNGFRIEGGPQIGFRTGAKEVTGETSIDIKSQTTAADFGLGLGVGYLTPSGFGIDARYNWGLTNINKHNTMSSMNRGLQLGLFYQFGQAGIKTNAHNSKYTK
ncbi:MAG: PorT family protein [Bacteroidetes bacterium]|nr:MAG: PorT family protein [Bacteroidota bacterium]